MNFNIDYEKLSDPLYVAKKLISFPSETPKDEGALLFVEEILTFLGFECYRMPSGQINGEGKEALVNNLYAKTGQGKNLCFAGHTDVVPAGNKEKWSTLPYDAQVIDGNLIGRGAADMKGSIAAFISAFARYINEFDKSFCISFLLTGDEEGHAKHGTKTMLPKLKDMGEKIDHCIVGEPTNPNKLGEMIKIGRRGSMHGLLTVYGKEGHVAYPHKAANPLPIMSKFISAISEMNLDQGNEHFQPSNLEFISIDVGNNVSNVIPLKIEAKFNIRFNTLQSERNLINIIQEKIKTVSYDKNIFKWKLDCELSGEPFITEPDDFINLVEESIKNNTGLKPELSTSGGTSDARFIKDICNVIEFGLVGKTMHQIDESIKVKDLELLTNIYYDIIKRYHQNISV
ncbi:MAG: Succinyl-diaminopimelate desuccinylase [Alphaproteobacteria bacterium MarineAlpha9_Bin3]|nr:MAG: Succinyl-diaminopimelate desuccinylase [Alphaproteobacteria bacterium MarineAlpha9_Bin3]